MPSRRKTEPSPEEVPEEGVQETEDRTQPPDPPIPDIGYISPEWARASIGEKVVIDKTIVDVDQKG